MLGKYSIENDQDLNINVVSNTNYFAIFREIFIPTNNC